MTHCVLGFLHDNRRHRNQKEGDSKWSLVADSLKSQTDSIEGDVKDEVTGKILRLRLTTALEDASVVRIHLNEVGSERGRYEATEALNEGIKFSQMSLKESSGNGFTATFGHQGKVFVNANPFRIDVYDGDRLKVIVNHRNLFKFEHYRPKTDDEKNENGEWDETFKTHTDSKPYGPMSVGMDISFVDYEHLYGLPEHADSFSLKNTKGESDPYRLFNLDVFEYDLYNPMALYGSIPMVVAHSSESTLGLLWLNPSETWVDIESSSLSSGFVSNLVGGESKARMTHWISETGVVDIWIMMGPTPQDVSKQNAALSGTHEMPPYYSIGYHQSRWNYYTQEEVADVDQQFDDHDIPLDAIWLDIEYTEGRSKKYFTWDKIAFKDHNTLIANLTSKGRRLITIIDPHIKRDTGYPVYNEGVEQHMFIKNKDGSDYDGWCWPGSSSWPDYVNPKVCEWWANKFDPEYFPGFTGGLVDIWNDMNEPSVFSGPEVTCPKDVVHYNNWENRDVHNIYGQLMTKSTFQGLSKHRPNQRSFILTRAFFYGSQKYCAAWTGDNMAKFEHLKMTVPMILSQSVVGMSFVGADVPGFFFNPEPELIVRWYQAATFQPFLRGHGHIDTKRREPWTFDDNVKELIRTALRTRYLYLPYMYTLFYENHVHGYPINRPLWYHFSHDVNCFSAEESFLLGRDLLVHPVMEKQVTSLNVYFPGNETDFWYDFESNKLFSGGSSHAFPVSLKTMPYFQRSGSIIPRRQRIRRSAALTLDDPITLDIVLDASGHADGQLYLDDGNSLDYKKGQYLLTSFNISQGQLSNHVMKGNLKTDVWLERVNIRQIKSKPSKVRVTVGGKTTFLEFKMIHDNILVIRKPEVKMSSEWVITIR